MKIAATYDNGNIFQHFGKTEFFKVYEVEDNKVVSSEVISSNGTGHGALAGLLAEQGIRSVEESAVEHRVHLLRLALSYVPEHREMQTQLWMLI